MRYTITKQRIQIIGHIWWPSGAVCAQELDLSGYDLANIPDPRNRDDVSQWIDRNSGDFSNVVDFRADFHIGDGNVVHEWAKGEDSEMAFCDAMYPVED